MGEGDPAPGGPCERHPTHEGGIRLDHKGTALLQLLDAQAQSLFGCPSSPMCGHQPARIIDAEGARDCQDLMVTPEHGKIRRAGKRKAGKQSPKSPDAGPLLGGSAAHDSKRADVGRGDGHVEGGGDAQTPRGGGEATPSTPQSELCASMRVMPGSGARRWASPAGPLEAVDAAARILQRAFARRRLLTAARLEEQRAMMARVQGLIQPAPRAPAPGASPPLAAVTHICEASDEAVYVASASDTPIFAAETPMHTAFVTPVYAADTPHDDKSFVGARPRFGDSSTSVFSDWSACENSVQPSDSSVQRGSSRSVVKPGEAQDAQRLLDAAWDYSLPEVSPDGLEARHAAIFPLLGRTLSAPQALGLGKIEPSRPGSSPLRRVNSCQGDIHAGGRSLFSVRGRNQTFPGPTREEPARSAEPVRSILSRAVHKVAKRFHPPRP